MGAISKITDAILFIFFLIVAVIAPLLDGQVILPTNLYPEFLIDLKKWYIDEVDDYLVAEKPHFFVGIIWIELLFQWPLALLSLYGILTSKPWIRTTCLIFGASFFTSMGALLAELKGAGKASDKMLMIYSPCMGFGILAILRGLIPLSSKIDSAARKKTV
ncbi:uncharacterized protein LOC126656446 isoform X1 [Mercurialis annua]|uniref:uncharacterized protein LOC126656446 isoform X1 n=1 Tax=Mercurialis annua TaxID=3986 RepID=UPI00215FB98D|nr:uncharacterized protein LOC126656446 isoform X1 [Mercurialis annua]